MKESTIEKYLRKEVKALGGWMQKMASPGVRGCPDNLILWPCKEPRHCIMDLDEARTHMERVEFIETKAPKKGPTVLQRRDHARRRAMGFQVHVISTMDQAETYLRSRGKE